MREIDRAEARLWRGLAAGLALALPIWTAVAVALWSLVW